MDSKIYFQFKVIALIFFILFTCSLVYSNSQLTEHRNRVILLNAAGIQRLFINDYTASIQWEERAYLPMNASPARISGIIDQNYSAFLKGGTLVYSTDGQSANIKKITDSQVVAAISAAQEKWQKLKDVSAMQPPEAERIATAYYDALQAQDRATIVIQHHIKDGLAKLLFSERIIFMNAILLLLVSLFYARYRIADPVERNRRKLKEQERILKEQIDEQTKDLTRQKEKAEIADKAKADFLANMSHELRTPLNSILGLTRLLSDSQLTHKQKELSSTILYSSEHLLAIVNDILDISKIEAGEIRLESIGIDLEYLLGSMIMMHETMAAEKGLKLTKHSKAVCLPYVLSDPTRLSQVMNNLISNAIKYTKAGQVKLAYDFTHTDPDHICFTCSVTDTGIGIPKDKIGIIFDKFAQVDITDTRKYGGTGLGLAITKKLVTLMGGEIKLESIADKGSTFTVILPFEITDTLHTDLTPKDDNVEEQQRHGDFAPDAVRILIAEDNPMNQMLIRKLMERYGIVNYKLVENGEDAMQAYHTGEFDLILMDCHMPKRSGYDVAKEIRQSEWLSDLHIPIIAMTANAMPGDREKCLSAGMDDYISKPINEKELQKVMGQYIRFS